MSASKIVLLALAISMALTAVEAPWRTYERSRQTKSGSRSTQRRATCQIKRLTTKRSAAIGGVAHASVARLIIL